MNKAETKRTIRKIRKRLQAGLGYIPLVLFLSFPLRVSRRIGQIVGTLAYYVAIKDRDRSITQFHEAFSGEYTVKESSAMIKQTFVHFGKSLAEFLYYYHFPRTNPFYHFTSYNEEALMRAYQKNKGVIIVTGHIGNWEYLAGYIAQRGYPMTVLARENPVPAFDRIMSKLRLKVGYRPLERGTLQAAKESIRQLRQGNLLGLLIDQDTKVDGTFVDFFGKQAFTPVGAATLAMKTKSSIVIVYTRRLRDDSVAVYFDNPVTIKLSSDKKTAAKELTAHLTKRLEEIIRMTPEQWVWMHRRWKTRPSGEA